MNNVAAVTLRVAIPTSILEVESSLALKSIRINQVARWCSIFGVYEVIFYKDPFTSDELFKEHKTVIKDHWRYFFTPPYLRKLLVPLTPALKYVGMLPPIRLNIFNVNRRPKAGELRLGFLYRDSSGELKALVGNSVPYDVLGECGKEQRIVLFLVKDEKRHLVECVDKPVYTGPQLTFSSSLREVIEKYRKTRNSFIVATDRKGEIPLPHVVEGMRGSNLVLLFGSPKYDLFEIASQEGFHLEDHVDYVWNTIPRQKVVTVRTEEALIITLGIINAFLRGI